MQKDNKVKLSEQIIMLSKASEILDNELKMLNKEFSGLNKNLDEIGVEIEKQKKGVEELDREAGKELENVHRKKKELVNLKNKTREENIVETIQYIINILVILVISYIKNPIGFIIAILICLAYMVIAVLLELFKVIKDHPLNFYWKGMAKSFLQTIIPIVMICLLNYITGQGEAESVDYNIIMMIYLVVIIVFVYALIGVSHVIEKIFNSILRAEKNKCKSVFKESIRGGYLLDAWRK